MKKKVLIFSIIGALVVAGVVLGIIFWPKGGKQVNEDPFFPKYNFTLSNLTDEFKIPVYSHAVNSEGKEVEPQGLKFIQKDGTYKFRDIQVSEPDENGNVKVTITYDQSVEVDFISSNTDKDWYYTYSCISFALFDYYTGEIYRIKSVNDGDNTTNILNEGIYTSAEGAEPAYTDINFNGKTTRVGILRRFMQGVWQDVKLIEETPEGNHYLAVQDSTIAIDVTIPKDYDGLMLFINKEGNDQKDAREEFEKYEKLVALQKDAQEKGVKSQELIDIENEKNQIHKIIDSNDEKRKDRKPEDYYVIKVSDFINK